VGVCVYVVRLKVYGVCVCVCGVYCVCGVCMCACVLGGCLCVLCVWVSMWSVIV